RSQFSKRRVSLNRDRAKLVIVRNADELRLHLDLREALEGNALPVWSRHIESANLLHFAAVLDAAANQDRNEPVPFAQFRHLQTFKGGQGHTADLFVIQAE